MPSSSAPFPQDEPGNPAVVDLQYVGALVAHLFFDQIATPKSLQTQYENTPPLSAEQKDGQWAVVSFIPGGANQIEVSPPRTRRTGLAQITVFGPADEGDKDLLLLARDIERAFRQQTVSQVTFRTPETVNRGRDGKWWSLIVRCPLFWEEI